MRYVNAPVMGISLTESILYITEFDKRKSCVIEQEKSKANVEGVQKVTIHCCVISPTFYIFLEVTIYSERRDS